MREARPALTTSLPGDEAQPQGTAALQVSPSRSMWSAQTAQLLQGSPSDPLTPARLVLSISRQALMGAEQCTEISSAEDRELSESEGTDPEPQQSSYIC